MGKTIIKEMIIFLLLLISIALVLLVLMYEYIPSAQTMPPKLESYMLPKEIQEELNVMLSQTGRGNEVRTYSVDNSDLRNYEDTNQYDKGKSNPFERFAQLVTEQGMAGNNTNNKQNTTTNTNTNNNTTTNNNNNNNGVKNDVGNFYNNTTENNMTTK